ncbi:MAG: TIM barrel protein [Phycisphaeraceae bacterium]
MATCRQNDQLFTCQGSIPTNHPEPVQPRIPDAGLFFARATRPCRGSSAQHAPRMGETAACTSTAPASQPAAPTQYHGQRHRWPRHQSPRPSEPAMPEPRIPRLLFVCTGNAGRSQIAHALANQSLGHQAYVASAGVDPWNDLHPMARQLMTARGISLDGHHPRHAASLNDLRFDLVVTIGDPARRQLPDPLRQSRWIHWDLPDPADADGTDRSESVFTQTIHWIEQRLPEVITWIKRAANPQPTWSPGIGTGLWCRDERFQPARHLPLAAAAGFTSIELNLYGSFAFDIRNQANYAQLKRTLADCDMNVASIHAPDGGHLGAADPDAREQQMDILKWCIDVAQDLNAATVVSHGLLLLGKQSPPDEPATDRRIAASLTDLAPLLESTPTRIAFENGRGNQPGAFAADVLRRLQGHSPAAFGFALDSGHANIAGDLDTIVRDVGAQLISLHLNDNDGQRDTHMPPGRGNVNWPSIIGLLKNIPFQGTIMYEILPSDEPVEATLKCIADWHRSMLASTAPDPPSRSR